MSSSFKSHENLLSSRALERSDSIHVDSPNLSRTRIANSRHRSCVYGTEKIGESAYSSLQIEKQLWKNLIVVTIGHVFVFSAFYALQSLQSSLFMESSLGLEALTVVYGCASLSGFYGSAFVRKFTPNWTAELSTVFVSLFVSSYFYPRLYSVLPCAVALGLAFGLFFTAEMTFLMTLISRMSYLTSSIREKIQLKYLRLFLFFSNSSRLWGHIVVAVLIHYGGDIYVFFTGYHHHLLRGMNFPFSVADMNMSPSPYATVARPSLCSLEKASDDHIFRNPTSFVFILPSNLTLMLISVFLGMTFLGVATFTTLLDKCDLYVREDAQEKIILGQHVWKVLVMFFDPELRLWIPMIIFTGLAQGFLNADFTRSYVSCALGFEVIAYTMICHGGMNCVAAALVHVFSSFIRRAIVMSIAVVCQAGLLMVLWLWVPIKDDVAVFYIITAGWGVCQAIWETYITSHITTTYAEDWPSAFSVYFISQWIGLAVAFGWSSVLVTEMKIYILAGMLIVSIIPYAFVEIRKHQKRKEQERVAEL